MKFHWTMISLLYWRASVIIDYVQLKLSELTKVFVTGQTFSLVRYFLVIFYPDYDRIRSRLEKRSS